MPTVDRAPESVTRPLPQISSSRQRFVDATGRLRPHYPRERSSNDDEDYDELRTDPRALASGTEGGVYNTLNRPRTTSIQVDDQPVPDQELRVRGVREWLDNGEERQDYLIDADDLSLRRLMLDDNAKVSGSGPGVTSI